MTLSNKVTQFGNDADITHQIVHGDANTVVQTEGGPVRSLAKLLADNQGNLAAQASLRADLANYGQGLGGVKYGSQLVGHNAAYTVGTLLDALLSTGGAAAVGTSDGSNVQSRLNTLLTANGLKEPSIAAGNTGQYWRGDKTWQDYNTATLNATLVGVGSTAGVIGASDTILSAFSKTKAAQAASELRANKGVASGYAALNASSQLVLPNTAQTFQSVLTNANTAARTYTLPDKDGTVATLADIPASSSGSLVLVASQTFSAVSIVNFLTAFTSAYDLYIIEFSPVVLSAAGNIQMQVGVGGTAMGATNTYGLGIAGTASFSPTGAAFSLASSALQLKGIAELRDVNDTTAGGTGFYKGFGLRGYQYDGTTFYARNVEGVFIGSANALSGFCVYPSTGTLSGTIRVFGVKNT